MPSTYTLIASSVLGSSQSSVTFSSIPNTYTDLALRVSGRSDDSSNSSNSIRFFVNSNTGTVYSFTRILGNGTSVASYSAPANTDELYFNNGLSTALSTSNTFGNAEIYIPNYRSSTNKPVGSFQVAETNSLPVSVGMTAGSIRITSAITTIEVTLNPTKSFVTGSSFYLYGIKNS